MSDAVALCRTIVTLDALYLDVRYKNEAQQVCELWTWHGERLVLFTTSVLSFFRFASLSLRSRALSISRHLKQLLFKSRRLS